MRRLGVVLGLVGVLALASPAMARMASFEATTPLQDHSKQSIEMAVIEAVEAGVQSAIAMGFSWIQVSPPLLLDDKVVVHFAATDVDPEGSGDGGSRIGGKLGDDGDSLRDGPDLEHF